MFNVDHKSDKMFAVGKHPTKHNSWNSYCNKYQMWACFKVEGMNFYTEKENNLKTRQSIRIAYKQFRLCVYNVNKMPKTDMKNMIDQTERSNWEYLNSAKLWNKYSSCRKKKKSLKLWKITCLKWSFVDTCSFSPTFFCFLFLKVQV